VCADAERAAWTVAPSEVSASPWCFTRLIGDTPPMKIATSASRLELTFRHVRSGDSSVDIA
jgi:hypothetical protein